MSQPVATPNQPFLSDRQLAKLAVFAAIIIVGLVGLFVARRIIDPLDRLLTETTCSAFGEDELSRELVDFEPSNRFAVVDRTQGSCTFGPVVVFDEDGNVLEDPTPEEVAAAAEAAEAAAALDAEDADAEPIPEVIANAPDDEPLMLALPDVETGGFYRGMKWVFVLAQLGVASSAARVVADPLLDRFVRRPG